MPKEPKYSHKNPHPDFKRAVERNKAAEERERDIRKYMHVLEEKVGQGLREAPLNKHSRHEFELIIKKDEKIVDRCTLSIRKGGGDLKMNYFGGTLVTGFEEKIKVLRAFLDQNPR